jgi:hypothetical protein
LWVWLTIGLIGVGFIAYADFFARIKARQNAAASIREPRIIEVIGSGHHVLIGPASSAC